MTDTSPKAPSTRRRIFSTEDAIDVSIADCMFEAPPRYDKLGENLDDYLYRISAFSRLEATIGTLVSAVPWDVLCSWAATVVSSYEAQHQGVTRTTPLGVLQEVTACELTKATILRLRGRLYGTEPVRPLSVGEIEPIFTDKTAWFGRNSGFVIEVNDFNEDGTRNGNVSLVEGATVDVQARVVFSGYGRLEVYGKKLATPIHEDLMSIVHPDRTKAIAVRMLRADTTSRRVLDVFREHIIQGSIRVVAWGHPDNQRLMIR